MIDHKARFAAAPAFNAFMDRDGSWKHRRRWVAVYDQFELMDA